MSDTEPEDDSDNEDDGILNAFTATVNPTEGIVKDVDEEEELVESKSELSWKGLQVLSSMRCSVFRNLLLIEQV